MEFSIDYTADVQQKSLMYDVEECAFYTNPSVNEINFDIVLNKLNLTTVDDDNKIVQLWGFCGYKEWINAKYNVPKSRTGALKIIETLEGGLAYKISNEDFPVYVNKQSGWICIGNPEEKGNAVEFITGCVAVINDDKNFVSLWLKPQSLPDV